jgi:hypothetical protein
MLLKNSKEREKKREEERDEVRRREKLDQDSSDLNCKSTKRFTHYAS